MGLRAEIDQAALESSIARQLGAWFTRRVEAAADLARTEAPRGEGGAARTEGGIADNIIVHYNIDGLRFSATIVANTAYAAAVHNGAVPHPIRPKNGTGLAFQGSDGRVVISGSKTGRKQAFRTKTGTLVILMPDPHVDHPGNQPNPFLRNAVLRSLAS